MTLKIEELNDVVIKFAGDSGDGMQLTGSQFTNNSALMGLDLATFPDYPAEIRAPQGTVSGVSGFQLRFSSDAIFTPGDLCDVLVAMNAAALKSNMKYLKKGAKIIVNLDGFDKRNLRLAEYPENTNPLEDGSLNNYSVIKIDITKLTRETLKDFQLGIKDKDRAKNMFVLGFLYWMFNRDIDSTVSFLQSKFGKKEIILNTNIAVLKAGYNYANTIEAISGTYSIGKSKMSPGEYRSVMGNQATSLGLIAAATKANLPLFLGSYPITPASEILHDLSEYKNFNVKTFQAEDEIAGICTAIGASYGGALGVTTTSGPGLALKTEAIGLAVMLEIPLVVVNVQRGGPSTGLPTKTEQSDLLQAVYGRNGECPLPVVAANSPADCFEAVFEAARIALTHMTPVLFLSDGYIGNGAEPWKLVKSSELPEIKVKFKTQRDANEETLMPYSRDENYVRPWIVPGTKGLEHRIGGIEKQNLTGKISYDSENHQTMVKLRQAKVDKIVDDIPLAKIETGNDKGDVLVLGWGSTHGSIKSAVLELVAQGKSVSQLHLRYINPLPKNLGEILKNFKKIIIPEINNGQLIKLIREKYLIAPIGYNKIMGVPITKSELIEEIKKHL